MSYTHNVNTETNLPDETVMTTNVPGTITANISEGHPEQSTADPKEEQHATPAEVKQQRRNSLSKVMDAIKKPFRKESKDTHSEPTQPRPTGGMATGGSPESAGFTNPFPEKK